MKIALNIVLFLACFAFLLPAYSQEITIVPDSIWESPSFIISYGKEQASIGNLKTIEIIENDIFGGIDRLFHAINTEKGYKNEYIQAYGKALKKALPENKARFPQKQRL